MTEENAKQKPALKHRDRRLSAGPLPEIKRAKAVVYCRVSSKKQAADGAGLESQERRT